ncbi:hypothetical protein FHS59_004161 [Algoriphagus iocasae]|uniref:Uncharacterized protein n=1 Tax=Algoriphagus iocasae TaxID=1836499 RepID=A0A841N1F4_9BACT|nr:hypothetical protein [Algoriphagus iocasae]
MEDFSSDSIMQLWKKEYSSCLSKYSKFDATHQFHQIAGMCTPRLGVVRSFLGLGVVCNYTHLS